MLGHRSPCSQLLASVVGWTAEDAADRVFLQSILTCIVCFWMTGCVMNGWASTRAQLCGTAYKTRHRGQSDEGDWQAGGGLGDVNRPERADALVPCQRLVTGDR